jgi:hypothetical protein
MSPLTRSVLLIGVGACTLWAQARRCEPDSVLTELMTDHVCSLEESRIQTIAREYGSYRSANCGDSQTYRDPNVALNQVRTMQKQLCDARKGARPDALPPFEAAIYAMTDGRKLNPCTYDPKADNFAVLNAPEYFPYNNRRSYDNGITYRRLELYLEERADEQQAACFLNFLKSGITGEEWHPPMKAEVLPDQKPADMSVPSLPQQAASRPATAPPSPPVATTAPPVRTVLPASPVYSGLRSGRLTYSGPPVPQNGVVVFNGLPAGAIRLVYDATRWRHRFAPGPGGTQRLILTYLKPGLEKKLEVTWSLENSPGR